MSMFVCMIWIVVDNISIKEYIECMQLQFLIIVGEFNSVE